MPSLLEELSQTEKEKLFEAVAVAYAAAQANATAKDSAAAVDPPEAQTNTDASVTTSNAATSPGTFTWRGANISHEVDRAGAGIGTGTRVDPNTSRSSYATDVAQRFNFAAGSARTTVRGRNSRGAPSAPIRISKREIWLIPFCGWGLCLDKKDKPHDNNGATIEVEQFLHKQRCVIPCGEIKKQMTAAEVMEVIQTEFEKKGWDLKKDGFLYGKSLGTRQVLTKADLVTHEVDSDVLQQQFVNQRCIIVRNTKECPEEFESYFHTSELPPLHQQERNDLIECDHCLLIMPRSIYLDHMVLCPRKMAGYPKCPRKPFYRGPIGSVLSLDFEQTAFWRQSENLHIPERQVENALHQRNPDRLPEWMDKSKWCLCQGLGRSLRKDWIQCASQERCCVRWFHDTCAEFLGADLDADWTCMMCCLQKVMAKGKRRRRDP